jgi:hypothetical protein
MSKRRQTIKSNGQNREMGRRHRLSNLNLKNKSRKNTAIASRPRLDLWIKRTKIEQVRKHKILGLIFVTRMNWNEHILSKKVKAEKININKCLAHTKWGGGRPRETVSLNAK